MQTCDRCGREAEELIAQADGKLFCRPCHLGLSPEITDEEYNRLRMTYDRDAEFKSLRHRFWALGLARRFRVLTTLGYAHAGESILEKTERFRLYKIKENGEEEALIELIEAQEAEILAENEKSEYIKPQDIPTGEVTGRTHAGRVKLTAGPTNPVPNPWEDSQK
jgi:hypothetical protein